MSDLAHELKTSLAVIYGYAELLETRSDEGARLEAAAMIKEAVARLQVATDRLAETA